MRLTSILSFVVLLSTGASLPYLLNAYVESGYKQTEEKSDQAPVFRNLAWGWKAAPLRKLPETVTCLRSSPGRNRQEIEITVGTGPMGGVYSFNPGVGVNSFRTIGALLGELMPGGSCDVSSLEHIDLDGDGKRELIAHTDQIVPRGAPKLFVWQTDPLPRLRAMATPRIQSSWNHGVAAFPLNNSPAQTNLLSAYCGFGEIVEYSLAPAGSNGFEGESVLWKQVGTLPCSGEQVLVADADNDEQRDVCVAMGYQHENAAIRVYSSVEGAEAESFQFAGRTWRQRLEIREDGRFGNVRFVIAAIQPEQDNDLYAWWCSDLAGGDCEFIRYRIGLHGVGDRQVLARGPAEKLWPLASQIDVADLDNDGSAEVWFATRPGWLWCFDPKRSSPVTRIGRIPEGIGPIVASIPQFHGKRQLMVASGEHLLSLEPINSKVQLLASRRPRRLRSLRT